MCRADHPDGRSLLLGVLSSQGFTYEVEKVTDDEWKVRFEQAG